jgi:hypothetical protein
MIYIYLLKLGLNPVAAVGNLFKNRKGTSQNEK